MFSQFVGILPAAGTGSRLRPLQYPKELMPIMFECDSEEHRIKPSLVIEHSLRAMKHACVECCLIVTSDSKLEVLRYLGDGGQYGLRLGYVVQPEPLGLAHAVAQACKLVKQFQANICMAMPDTVYDPHNSLKIINDELINHRADLVLGVFPTAVPGELGPVEMGVDGIVRAVFDKPAETDLYNTWAIAAWAPEFSELLLSQVASVAEGEELILGSLFNLACQVGMHVRAVSFLGGGFHDLGTKAGLTRAYLQTLKS